MENTIKDLEARDGDFDNAAKLNKRSDSVMSILSSEEYDAPIDIAMSSSPLDWQYQFSGPVAAPPTVSPAIPATVPTTFVETFQASRFKVSLHPYRRRCAYGRWGGIEVIIQMRSYLDQVAGISSDHSLAKLMIDALDQPHPLEIAPSFSASSIFSPSKQCLLDKVDLAFTGILASWPFIDRLDINAAIVALYSSGSTSTCHVRHDQMALIYAVSAIGSCTSALLSWGMEAPDAQGNRTG